MSAEWSEVVGYSGRYEVSDDGRVRTVARSIQVGAGPGTRFLPSREIYQHMLPTGLQCTLWVGHSGKTFRVAVLVANAFHGPRPNPTDHCCHNDGNQSNNNASNLRWDTPQSNVDDRTRHGTTACGIRSPRAKLTEQQVREIRSAVGSQRQVAARYGVSAFTVAGIRKRQSWKELPDA